MAKILVSKKIVRIIRTGRQGPPGSAADIAAHEAAADPHAPYYLSDGSKDLEGALTFGSSPDIIDLFPAVGPGAASSLQQGWSVVHSSGVGFGGTLVDTGSNTFKVNAGVASLRETSDVSSPSHPVFWNDTTGFTIALNETKYVGITWNAGNPLPVTRPADTWNGSDEIGFGRVHRDAAGVHISNDPQILGDSNLLGQRRDEETQPLARDRTVADSLVISETGTRNIVMSAGAVWNKLNRHSVSSIDTSASDTFDIYYRDGSGGYNITLAQTQWPNTVIDDGSGVLATLGNNKWAVIFFFVTLSGEIAGVYGRVESNGQAAAALEFVPVDMPPRLLIRHARAIARLSFQKDAATGAIRTPFDPLF